MGIAWWLVPGASSAEILQSAINKAAGQHISPTFHPHITLFPLRSADKMVEELIKITQPVVAEARAPISVEQAGVTVGETFHQSIYLTLNLTAELRTIRANLLKAVGAPADLESPGFPHASLYYGDGSSEDKHHVVVQMKDAGALDILGDGSIEVTRLGPRFELTEVWIVDIVSQQPASWKVLHKQALAGGELASSLTPSPPASSPAPPLTPLRQITSGTTSSTSCSPTP